MEIPQASDAVGGSKPLWLVPGKGRAWLDFANDVTSKDIKLAAQEAFTVIAEGYRQGGESLSQFLSFFVSHFFKKLLLRFATF